MALQTGCTNIDVVNNKISRNAAHGIELTSTKHCTVRQNTIANNNSNNIAGFLCGLKLSGSNVDAVIIGNVVNNDVATYGQHAGIYISGALNNGTRYGGNVVYNNQDNQLFSETAAPQADVVLTY
jgi:parallel beta-helix repeat protein